MTAIETQRPRISRTTGPSVSQPGANREHGGYQGLQNKPKRERSIDASAKIHQHALQQFFHRLAFPAQL
jgi:hypothetical protein